ncbi:MAG: hypothetical protein QW756_05525 [Nitrososphaerota archaeon]
MLLEGYYVEDVHGDIYAVKGVSQPPGRVYAVPKLIREGGGYRRPTTLQSAVEYVALNRPEYMWKDLHTGRLQPTVPLHRISRVIKPSHEPSPKAPEKLRRKAIELAQIILGRYGMGGGLGLTGSVLLGYARDDSDIDYVAYGMQLGWHLHQAMSRLREEGVTQAVDQPSAQMLLHSRLDTQLAAWIIKRHEGRKVLTGVFDGTVYMVKLVPWPWEYWDDWGSTICKCLGRVRISAKVIDESLGIFTPSLYRVRTLESSPHTVNVSEIVSFRSRFAEHCGRGEVIEACGELEEVMSRDSQHLRLLVGWSTEDYLVSKY